MPATAFDVLLPGGAILALSGRMKVMGILNVTPDSFSDGGAYLDPDAAVARGLEMAAAGADLLDIGGESTRPGAAPISVAEEMRRVLPVIEALVSAVPIPLSIDTKNAETARAALAAGAVILNDVTGLRDPAMAAAAAETGAAVVLMHMRGTPATMREHANYDDVTADVCRELGESVRSAVAAGIPEERIILDPGIGFAKDAGQSATLIRELTTLLALGRPVLVGPSRKSFLTAFRNRPPTDRLALTLGAVAACVANGAHVLRVHDVAETVDFVAAWRGLGGGGRG
jgi:dihydropteroate synthase